MAARWGAGEEILTVSGMELLVAGAHLQCQAFEEDCTELADLSLSSLDTGGLLETFHGYIDHSIISIIDDPVTQAEIKDQFDDENELSLLTALTEILGNADDENMSPFDTIPETELLVSHKDRDSSVLQKFLSLSRTPPERDNGYMDRATSGKIDRSPATIWEQFPDSISSTPKRHRLKNVRSCLSRITRKEITQPRSDGEEEEVASPEKNFEAGNNLINFDKVLMESPNKTNEYEQSMPCVINTENVALNDLVKYMHPYCLPAVSICLEQENDEEMDENVAFLEIVSEDGECIKLPVLMQDPEEFLALESDGSITTFNALEPMNSEVGIQMPITGQCLEGPCPLGQETGGDQRLEAILDELEPCDKPLDQVSDAELMPSSSESGMQCLEALKTAHLLESESNQPDLNKQLVDPTLNDKTITENIEKETEQVSVANPSKVDHGKEAECNKPVAANRKRSIKKKQSRATKLKGKAKNKNAFEDKEQIIVEKMTVDKPAPPASKRPSINSMQESDFLIKQLDQAKKDSQMVRSKGRSRGGLENPHPLEKKLIGDLKKSAKVLEKEQPKVPADEDVALLERNVKGEGSEMIVSEPSQDPVNIDVQNAVPEEASESQLLEVPNVEDEDLTLQAKDVKPKSLSLSEYRKRLQQRKPDKEERDNENASGSKWPSIPEPPTELADIPCLILPGKDACSKSTKMSASDKDDKPSRLEVTSNLAPAATQETPYPKQPEMPTTFAVDQNPYTASLPPNVLPPYYPPAWPVSAHPYYHPLATVPPFPNCVPPDPLHIMPMHPPVMAWPPFPPPPISSDPAAWPPGFQHAYWQPPSVQQGIPDGMPPNALNAATSHIQPAVKIQQGAQVVSQQCTVVPLSGRESSHSVLGAKEACSSEVAKPSREPLNSSKAPFKPVENRAPVKQTAPIQKQSLPSLSKATDSQLPKLSPDPLPTVLAQQKKMTVPIPDLKSANQVVFKIMALLKKAQSRSAQTQPPPQAAPMNQKPLSTAPLLPVLCEMSELQPKIAPPLLTQPRATAVPERPHAAPKQVALDKPPPALHPKIENDKQAKVSRPAAETSLQLPSDHTGLAQSFPSEKGIEASDLTSLLEQFEKSEAKDEPVARCPEFNMAVGNSVSEKPAEKVLDKLLAPELASTAGLTPPATPPHQPWKLIVPGPGKSKPLQASASERICASPVKTTKLIEAKPLPRGKLRSRGSGVASKGLNPPVHVASGDHDYCILSSVIQPETCPDPALLTGEASPPAQPLQSEEGSRWNVKHHPNILIKPIIQFSQLRPSNVCQKLAPCDNPTQSVPCGAATPSPPCNAAVRKDQQDTLDHRTNNLEAAPKSPGSVLMSPDSSPCCSETRDTRTGVGKGEAPASRRSLRCYRKYRNSPSPETSTRRKSSGSRSESPSSSSSGSRSRSPPPKRRRRYTSRNSRRSRSSSGSSASRSSSSSSYSRSSSRSRSGSRHRYRSRSRRCESQESYNRQRIVHKERAIEERRVVYIGKINNLMTRSELKRRFSVFGEIEECTIHFREESDNYGFVTYRYTREAFNAIENGHKLRLPDELPFDLCFGGRRQFCRSNYADLDSNRDEFDPAPTRNKYETLDFDTLLKQAQRSIRR
ncbi:peroxisome proliferator-activated receptor gamma coactivator-related protein 1 [Pelodytes ibericus]